VFNVWAAGDSHVPKDRAMAGYESLATAIRQSQGEVEGYPGFEWDVMIDTGDLSASQSPPTDEDGRMVVRQYEALKGHRREDVYQVAGNHDGDYYDKGAGWWFRKWIDPLGESPEYSGVRAARRRFPVQGNWQCYCFQAVNILFLMLSDYNSAPAPVGRGHSREKLKGGYPAGAVTRETFNWWRRKVVENQDKIIITMHHHVLRDTTTRSKRGGGIGFHNKIGSGKNADGGGYLYYIVEDPAPERFAYTSDGHAFEDFLHAFHEEHGRPAIDFWMGGHSHAETPEHVKDGQGLTEVRWGVTFVQCSGLTVWHSGGVPVSRLLSFEDGSDRARLRMYLHGTDAPFVRKQWPRRYAAAKRDWRPGWYAPQERIVELRVPFQAPPGPRDDVDRPANPDEEIHR
jgi:hypothetical protein